MNFRIYVKSPEMRQYNAIGSGGTIAGKLIHALMWSTLEGAEKDFNALVKENPALAWQLRDTNQQIIKAYKP